MTSYSISAQIIFLSQSISKTYLTLYPNDGYELGFGRAGQYKGHSHLQFYDLLFSLKGLRSLDPVEMLPKGSLLVIQPKTYLPDIDIGDFFFLKFSPDPGPFKIPDKVVDRYHEGGIIGASEGFEKEFKWFPTIGGRESRIKLKLTIDRLTIQLGEKEITVTG
jgi:hypothetical protein